MCFLLPRWASHVAWLAKAFLQSGQYGRPPPGDAVPAPGDCWDSWRGELRAVLAAGDPRGPVRKAPGERMRASGCGWVSGRAHTRSAGCERATSLTGLDHGAKAGVHPALRPRQAAAPVYEDTPAPELSRGNTGMEIGGGSGAGEPAGAHRTGLVRGRPQWRPPGAAAGRRPTRRRRPSRSALRHGVHSVTCHPRPCPPAQRHRTPLPRPLSVPWCLQPAAAHHAAPPPRSAPRRSGRPCISINMWRLAD